MSSGKEENGWLKCIRYKWLFARQLTGRRGRIIAIVLALMLAGAGAAIPIGNWALGPLSFERAKDLSTIVLDRNGLLLRAFTTAESQRWRLPVRLDEVDPLYIRLLLSYEDKRFYRHHGIDLIATMRAIRQLIASRRVISGASTLTMQVARLLEPRDNRNLKAKIRQALRALELERRFSKRQIIELYLRLAPFGGNIEGVRAASLAYFGHGVARASGRLDRQAGMVRISISILPGWHVNSAHPLNDDYIPTSINAIPPAVIDGETGFPPAILRRLAFSPEKLSLFEGRVEINLPLALKNDRKQEVWTNL